ncbi:MAG: hypothetical protein SGILL_004899, partial [Bacillariaceae sp.]
MSNNSDEPPALANFDEDIDEDDISDDDDDDDLSVTDSSESVSVDSDLEEEDETGTAAAAAQHDLSSSGTASGGEVIMHHQFNKLMGQGCIAEGTDEDEDDFEEETA